MTSITSESPNLRDALLSVYPEPWRSMLETGLPELEIQIARLAGELLHVEQAGVTYDEAVRRQGEWPLMARVHFGLVDLLQFELSPELLFMVRGLMEHLRAQPHLEDLGRALFGRAARDQGAEGALLRFLLYEALRLNLWVAAWESPGVEALGGMRAADGEAERILRRRLKQDEMFDGEVRPLLVMFAELMEAVGGRFPKALAELRTRSPAIIEHYCGVVLEAVERARQVSAADAVLIRNDYARYVGEERLDALLLHERHPGLLPSEDAVYQRRHRLEARLRSAPLAKIDERRRMIDLLVEEARQ